MSKWKKVARLGVPGENESLTVLETEEGTRFLQIGFKTLLTRSAVDRLVKFLGRPDSTTLLNKLMPQGSSESRRSDGIPVY